MAILTVTETIAPFYEKAKEIQLTQADNTTKPTTDDIHVNNVENALNLSQYDEALSRSEEWGFMKPIRDWERRVGFVTPILWGNTIVITTLHLVTLIWFLGYIITNGLFRWQTFAFGIIMGQVAGFGVTAGAHRYWCHRSYKAKWPLQILLLTCYSVAGQNTIYEWVRDHRVHHKFSESTADPHDANRGFFFAHVGWLMMKKSPDVMREGRKIDMRDIENDPLVQFHTRYFTLFKVLFCFVLPCLVPAFVWGETIATTLMSQAFLRFTLSLNITWSVNSFAHLWGNKPYDRYIMPTENLAVSIVAMGEGWHNYHHTFPWDYKASELGMSFNLTTLLLDQFAKIGWAYDMKAASQSLVRNVIKKRGADSGKLVGDEMWRVIESTQ